MAKKTKNKFKIGDMITNGKELTGKVVGYDGEYYYYLDTNGIQQPLHQSNENHWHIVNIKKVDKSLNKEVEEYLKKHWTRVPDERLVDEPVYFVLENDLKALAKHFANWGRKHIEIEGEVL